MYDIRRNDIQSFNKEEPGSGNIPPFGIDLFVGKHEDIHVQRPQGAIERPLPIRPDENGRKRYGGQDERPVSAMGKFGKS